MHRIALAVAKGASAGQPQLRDLSGEKAPRTYVFEDAFSPSWDESILGAKDSSSALPLWWRFAREAHRRRAEYDAIVTWGEKLSLAMLMQQQLASPSKPH